MKPLDINHARVELKCGKNETIKETETMYARAKSVAESFGIGTYFDRAWDHGDEFCDGYVYPALRNLEQVLTALNEQDVGYDNIDLPSQAEGSNLHTRLTKQFPPLCGVSVNIEQSHATKK